MYRALITCKNMTFAMKIKQVLSYRGFYCEVIRIPRSLGLGSCSYGVEIKPSDLDEILPLLKKNQIFPLNVFISYEDGKFVPYK